MTDPAAIARQVDPTLMHPETPMEQNQVVALTANQKLPALNPLKARSTAASALIVLGAVAPLMPESWRTAATVDTDTALVWVDGAVAAVNQLIVAVNALIVLGGTAWLWLERRSPKRRLSIAAPL